MPKQAFDDLDLSDEELAALEEEEDEPTPEDEEQEDTPIGEGDEGDLDEAEDDDDRSAEDSAEAKKSEPPAADKPDADPGDDEELTLDEQPRVRLPRLEAPDLKKIDDDIAAATTEQDSLTDKFVNGEIEEGDFQKEMAKVNRKIAQLYGDRAAAAVKAEINQGTDQAEATNSWEATVASFMTKRDNKTLYADGTPGFKLLDQELARLSQTEDGKKMTHAQLLVAADKEVRKGLKSLMENMGAKLPEKNDEPAKKRKVTKRPREGVVTLGDLPASDRSDDDEFSDIDKMMNSRDPASLHKLEQMLATMTPEQQARYLEG